MQALSIERRPARGEKLIGVKMGLTSRAKMLQVERRRGGLGPAHRRHAARRRRVAVEATLCPSTHRAGTRLPPEGAAFGRSDRAEAIAAVGAIAPAMEIIDSRYREFQVRAAGRDRGQFLVVRVRGRRLGAPGPGLLQSRHRHGGRRAAGRDRFDRRDPRQSLPLARCGGAACGRGARTARGRMDHLGRRRNRRASASKSASRCG